MDLISNQFTPVRRYPLKQSNDNLTNAIKAITVSLAYYSVPTSRRHACRDWSDILYLLAVSVVHHQPTILAEHSAANPAAACILIHYQWQVGNWHLASGRARWGSDRLHSNDTEWLQHKITGKFGKNTSLYKAYQYYRVNCTASRQTPSTPSHSIHTGFSLQQCNPLLASGGSRIRKREGPRSSGMPHRHVDRGTEGVYS